MCNLQLKYVEIVMQQNNILDSSEPVLEQELRYVPRCGPGIEPYVNMCAVVAARSRYEQCGEYTVKRVITRVVTEVKSVLRIA